MEIISFADAATSLTTPQGGLLGFARLSSSSSSEVLSPLLTRALSISAGISPVDSIAPPAIRRDVYRSGPRTLTRKKRRAKRRSITGGGSDDGDDDNCFFGGGDGASEGQGPFGGSGFGGGSGGGRGWNFDGGSSSDWEDDSSSSSSPSDPAFDFVYEVLSWIVLSNCLHFAFKKLVRIVGDAIVDDPSREKVVTVY